MLRCQCTCVPTHNTTVCIAPAFEPVRSSAIDNKHTLLPALSESSYPVKFSVCAAFKCGGALALSPGGKVPSGSSRVGYCESKEQACLLLPEVLEG